MITPCKGSGFWVQGSKVLGSEVLGSRFIAAAGRRSGQFNRKRNFGNVFSHEELTKK
jgi:hypothetical protein